MEATVHATTVALGEAGVIVRGAAGTGKTTLALSLLAHFRVRGLFARLVADDRTALVPAGGRLVASAPEALSGRVEVRGDGIVTVPHLARVRLTHIVDLVAVDRVDRMPEDAARCLVLAGVALPRIAFAARSTVAATLAVAAMVERDGLTARRGP